MPMDDLSDPGGNEEGTPSGTEFGDFLGVDEGQDGEELGADGDPELDPEPDGAEGPAEEPEAAGEGSPEAEGAPSDESEPGSAIDQAGETAPDSTPEALQRRIGELEAERGRFLAMLQQLTQPPPQESAADAQRRGETERAARELQDAVAVFYDSSLSAEQRKDQLARFPVSTQRAALERVRQDEAAAALRAADPEGWAQARLAPMLGRLLEPHLQEVRRLQGELSARAFAEQHRDLIESDAGRTRLHELVVRERWPAQFAVQLVRKELALAEALKGKAKVDATARTQAATRNSRRDQASRRPEHKGHKRPPKLTGRERTFGDFYDAEASPED